MIVRALCKRLDIPDEELTKAALEHDLDEIVFGDIPSPMKQKMQLDGMNLNDYVAKEMRELTAFQKGILKIADLLDAILFLRDHKIDRHGEDVLRDVNHRLAHHMVACCSNSPTVKAEVNMFVSEMLL